MSHATELTGAAQRSYRVPVGTIVTVPGSVTDEDGVAVDITGAVITVRWKTASSDPDGSAAATASGTVANGPGGLYTFTVPSAATTTPGLFSYHVEVVVGAQTYYPQMGGWQVYVR